MANHESAKKAHRASLKRNRINNDRKSSIKTLAKKLTLSIQKKSIKESQQLLRLFQSSIMKCVTKKVFKLNNASRKVSQMSQRVALINVPQKNKSS